MLVYYFQVGPRSHTIAQEKRFVVAKKIKIHHRQSEAVEAMAVIATRWQWVQLGGGSNGGICGCCGNGSSLAAAAVRRQ